MHGSGSFSGQPPLPILSAIDDILQSLSLAWVGDFGPVQIFAFHGVVFKHGGASSADGGGVDVWHVGELLAEMGTVGGGVEGVLGWL